MPQSRRSDHVPRGYNAISELPGPVREKLLAYAELIRQWAPKLDLLAPGEPPRFERRHLEDSLKALPLIDACPEGPAIDVGSGAGLPGLPLAMAGSRPRSWRLLEPRRKRAGFLEEVVRELGLENVEIAATTAEQAARADKRYVVATARALAPPTMAFSLLEPLLRPGGIAIVWLGESAEVPPEAVLSAPGLATMPKMAPNRKNLD